MIIRTAPRITSPRQPLPIGRTGQPQPRPPLLQSPPQRAVRLSPALASRSPSDYMIHLVPHHSQLLKGSGPQGIVPPQGQSAVQFNYEPRDNKSNKSHSILKSFQNGVTMSSTARSMQASEKSQFQQTQRQEYFCPPSPVQLRKIEPVRRISQQRINVSPNSEQASSKSASQQNIHITIETNVPNDADLPPPKITVSHIQNCSSNGKQHITVMKSPKGIVLHPSINHSQPILVEQRNIASEPGQREKSMSNQFQAISIPQRIQHMPEVFRAIPPPPPQVTIVERRHSLSMDNKMLMRPQSQTSNGMVFTSCSGYPPHNPMVQQPITIQSSNTLSHFQPSTLSHFQQPVSFNLNQNIPPEQDDHCKEVQMVKTSELKVSDLKESSGFHSRGNMYPSKTQQNRHGWREEIYNEYYQQKEGESWLQQAKRQEQRKCGYVFEQRVSSNSRILINEIFQNETNKALLKMRSVEARTRANSYKKKFL